MKQLKYAFFGGEESKFAQIILDGLKNAGWQPMEEIRDAKKPLDISYLKSLGADFFLVAAFGKILKKDLIAIPPKGTIGVHPSLLPKYRGPSPIQSTILNDEKEIGTTLFLIDEKVDHGPVISHKSLAISHQDNYESLIKKLAELSVPLILETLPKYLSGEIQPEIQDEAAATYTKKFTGEDAKIKLSPVDLVSPINPKEAWLKIRALNPEPGAYTILKLKNGHDLRLKLLKADFIDNQLQLKKVQPEGKKPMDYKSFLNGYQHFLI